MAEQLTIDLVGQRGDGVSHSGPSVRFVPYTLPDEVVEVEPSPSQPDRCQVTRILTPSPERIAPFCPEFGVCGGCAIQHWQEAGYRAWKRGLVVEALSHAGITCKVGDLVDAHGDGRRRMTLHARRDHDGVLRVGFAAAGSHAIIDLKTCPILAPAMSGAFEAAHAIASLLKPVEKPLDIQITAASNGLDIDVRGTGPLPTKMISALSVLAETHNLARLTRHGELVLMRTPPVIEIGTAGVTLPPGSFLQATTMGETVLGDLVIKASKGAKNIADLFCGVGPFALRLAAGKARVTALDSNADAVHALQKAVAATPGLKPITTGVRDLFRRPLVPQELRDFDAVVIDPPRQGAEAQTKFLAASRVPVIVAVSCNANTFARDARMLIDGGYTLDGVTPVDQFRHSAHVELVARFRR